MTTTVNRAVKVNLIHTPPRRFWQRDRRWQPYHWIAFASNGKVLAVSSEFYTNRMDCLHAISLLFGDTNTVELVEDEQVIWTLRHPVVD